MSLSAIPFHVFASLLNPFFRAFHILFFSWNDQHLRFWFPAWNLCSVHTLLSVTYPYSLHLLDMMLWTMFIMMWHLNSFELIFFKLFMYFMGFHPFEMLRPVSGHSVGHAVLRQLGVQLGADVPQRQENMNDTKGDPFGYGSIPINTIFSGMNIHESQLFWCELQGYKVLTHCHF